MKIFTTIFLFIICHNAYSQDYYFINAENGLNVRSGSDLSSEKIAKLPFGMQVEKIADTEKELIIIDNGKQIKGRFVKIKYNNYTCLVIEKTKAFEAEGYVFDGYLKKQKNDDLIDITKIDKKKFTELSLNVAQEIQKPKMVKNLDSVKAILKNRVKWVTEFEIDTYERDDIIESITTENGQKLVFNQSCVDFGFLEGYSGYYPDYDILFLEGGHSIDVCFSIKTGETEQTIGNPEYIIPSPKNSYRLNGIFGGQECVSYFLQKKENGKFVYLTELSDDICIFKNFYWITETKFIYSKINYMTRAENGTEEYFIGEISVFN